MTRLLIVDDMPVIVNGLYQVFLEQEDIQLDVHKAFSASEALELMQQTEIDVLVSDIRMPEMSGLELFRKAKQLNAAIKVIFLTSYQDFEHAKEAINLGSFDFILKTEGDERIVQAVGNAVEALRNEQEASQLVDKAKQQYKQALPMLQERFLMELLQGRAFNEQVLRQQFAHLEFKLRVDLPVHLILTRIDRWKMSINWSDKALLRYAVRNVMNEYLSPTVHLTSIDYDPDRLVWFWQAQSASADNPFSARAVNHVYRTLETIQITCRNMFDLQISFILCDEPVQWDRAYDKLTTVERLSQSGIGLNSELLTTEQELEQNTRQRKASDEASLQGDAYLQLNPFTMLTGYLASGKQEEFFELYHQLVIQVERLEAPLNVRLEATSFLNSMFISYINRRQLFTDVSGWIDLERLHQFYAEEPWLDTADYYRRLATVLFQKTTQEQENKTLKLVYEVQQYITDHLSKDLSLQQLADHVHLNASYLSRLFKQVSGIGISDFIMDLRVQKAKEMLRDPNILIYEIAEALGYQSGVAFTRFFKKVMHTTPQEYRDSLGV